MPDWRRILILILVVISLFIIYKLVKKREIILQESEKKEEEEEILEPFSSLQLSNSENTTFPLKEYVIMSSWNSANDYNGKVSLDTLEKTLDRGYRFIDLEIFSVDNIPQVSFSNTKQNDTMDSAPILFLDVCRLIVTKGFTTPNGEDPLFLHLRIKTAKDDILEKMANIFNVEFMSRLYEGEVTGDTELSQLRKKVVIIVDRNYLPNIEVYKCEGTCTLDFKQFVNMYSGTPEFKNLTYVQKLEQTITPLMKTYKGRTNVSTFQMVTQPIGDLIVNKNSSDFLELIKNYKINVFPQKVFYPDEHLTLYENFFVDYGRRAFVPMSVAFNSLFQIDD